MTPEPDGQAREPAPTRVLIPLKSGLGDARVWEKLLPDNGLARALWKLARLPRAMSDSVFFRSKVQHVCAGCWAGWCDFLRKLYGQTQSLAMMDVYRVYWHLPVYIAGSVLQRCWVLEFIRGVCQVWRIRCAACRIPPCHWRGALPPRQHPRLQ